MVDFDTYFLFLATAFVLVLAPGPDTVLILSRTVTSGKTSGLLTLAGTQIGNIIHALLAGIGVSGVLLMYPVALDAMKFGGALYLMYLAYVTWNSSASIELTATNSFHKKGNWRCFTEGLLNNLANPKMIPFFIALFPQFINAANGSLALQSLQLGLTLACMALIWLSILIVLVSRFRNSIATNELFLRVANRFAALTFIGLAWRLASQENN